MADNIPRDKPDMAAAYAMAAEMFGLKLVYLEAGSGAPEPVPPEMVKVVKESINIPLLVGGGIRTPEAAEKAVEAGGDIIVTGTVAEDPEKLDVLREIIKAVKS
jgi:phosphoglycerol geranylgeranyltransferase